MADSWQSNEMSIIRFSEGDRKLEETKTVSALTGLNSDELHGTNTNAK